MWNETSIASIAPSTDGDPKALLPKPALIEAVEAGSIGEELGLEAGDKLLSINGKRPRDLIDYRYLIVEENFFQILS